MELVADADRTALGEHEISETAQTRTDKTDKTASDRVLSVLSVPFGAVCENWLDAAPYCAGLERLSAACPAGVPDDRWRLALADAERFLAEWGDAAERLGWTEADLFDLHETVPLSRVDRMGLVWLLKGERVVLLTEGVARLERGLAVYRRPQAAPSPEGPHAASGKATQPRPGPAGHSTAGAAERQP